MPPFLPPSSRTAFTVTELMIVIGIITLLVVLSIPVAGKFTQSGKSIRCINNLRQLHAAVLAYASDHSGEFPVDRNNPSTGTSWYGALAGSNAARSYLPQNGYITHGGYGKKRPPFFCPANPTRITASGHTGWSTYAINSNLYVTDTNTTNHEADDPDYRSRRTAQRIGNVSGDKVLLLDSCNLSTPTPTTTYKLAGARYSNPWNYSYPIHGDRVNVLFVGGHIKSPVVSPRPQTLAVGGDLVEMKAEWFWPLN